MSLDPAPSRRLDRALDSLWYLASAPQTLALLTALLAVLLAFAADIPQAPFFLDAAAEERWLASQLPQFGRMGAFLRAIGAFTVLDGLLVHFLLAALAFNLTLRLAAQIDFLVRMLRQESVPAAPAGLPVEQTTVVAPLADAAQRLAEACRAHFTTTRVAEQDAHVQIYAERRRAGAIGPALTYLGALLLIVGLLVNALLGWRTPASVILAPGGTTTVGSDEDVTLTLDALTDAPEAFSTLTLSQNGRVTTVHSGFVSPGRWGNIWLAQRATGPALTVTARDPSARPLLMQSLAADGEIGETIQLLFGQTQNEEAFAIPTRNLTLRAVYYPALPDRGITQPVYQVEAYHEDEGEPLVSALVEDEAEVSVDGVVLSLRSDRYVELAVAYLPGLSLMAAGGLLLLLGALLSACCGPVRVWGDLTEDKEHVRVVVRCAPSAFPQPEITALLDAATAPSEVPAELTHDA